MGVGVVHAGGEDVEHLLAVGRARGRAGRVTTRVSGPPNSVIWMARIRRDAYAASAATARAARIALARARREPDPVLVTGGNRGIGLAIARAFAANGDRVAVTHRGSGAPDGLFGVQCDVTVHRAGRRGVHARSRPNSARSRCWSSNAGMTDDTLLLRMSEDSFTRRASTPT